MNNSKTKYKILIPEVPIAIIVLLLALAAIILTIIGALKTDRSLSILPTQKTISAQVLDDQYGLQVNLIAVTASGGIVDLRLTLNNGAKAKTLLADQANFPKIITADGTVLQTSEDIASQSIKFENGNHLYIFYPNTQNAVKPGDPVSILFGDVQVESIDSR